MSTAAAISCVVWIPVELVTPTASGSSANPVVRDDDRARAEPPERRRAVERERDDGVVDRHRGDRQVVALRVAHEDADLAGPELDAADVELVRRGRALADEVDDPVAERDDERHGEREPRRSGRAPTAARRFRRPARRATPSLVLDLEVAHPAELGELGLVRVEHERPACAKRISSTPRWPWHCITVSVYSQCSPVPVGW